MGRRMSFSFDPNMGMKTTSGCLSLVGRVGTISSVEILLLVLVPNSSPSSATSVISKLSSADFAVGLLLRFLRPTPDLRFFADEGVE